MQSERAATQKSKNIDWLTILLVLALVTFSVVTIANVMAEPFTGDETGIRDIQAKLNLEYVQRQIINFLVGVAACLVVTVIDYQLYKPIIKYVYIANILLLALLFVASTSTRSAIRWYYIGSFALQPSELCKITLIVSLSKIAADAVERDGSLKTLKDIAVMILNFAVPFMLVFMQPDLGTSLVFAVLFAAIVFVSKISWKYIVAAVAGIAALAPIAYFYLLNDEQVKRIDVFLNPEADLQGSGMHVYLSKIAVGSGGMTGKGYFTEGTLAQLKFVPERHNDFIFSGIAEGLGFVGGVALIVLYFALIFRWLWVAFRAKDHFGTCLVIGVIGMIAAQVFENIGMTIGLMPVTGIPLPFMSYGGSNMLTNMIAVGIVLNVWMRRLQVRK